LRPNAHRTSNPWRRASESNIESHCGRRRPAVAAHQEPDREPEHSAPPRARERSRRRGRRLPRPFSMKKGWLSTWVRVWCSGSLVRSAGGSGAHLSMACSAAGLGVMGGRLRGLKSKRAVRRPTRWSGWLAYLELLGGDGGDAIAASSENSQAAKQDVNRCTCSQQIGRACA
jgi:hypothetical protein